MSEDNAKEKSSHSGIMGNITAKITAITAALAALAALIDISVSISNKTLPLMCGILSGTSLCGGASEGKNNKPNPSPRPTPPPTFGLDTDVADFCNMHLPKERVLIGSIPLSDSEEDGIEIDDRPNKDTKYLFVSLTPSPYSAYIDVGYNNGAGIQVGNSIKPGTKCAVASFNPSVGARGIRAAAKYHANQNFGMILIGVWRLD